MPSYDLKCANGHKQTVRMSFVEYDYFKIVQVYEGNQCRQSGRGWLCWANTRITIQAVPKVFAINDGEFEISKRRFGIGQNLKEI